MVITNGSLTDLGFGSHIEYDNKTGEPVRIYWTEQMWQEFLAS